MWGCSNDEPGSKIDYGKLRIGKMDLSGAVSIGLKGQGNSSRAIDGEYLSAGLYKVDASGNISAVGVYFTTDTLGNRLEHEEALRVVPKQLFDLTDNYMLVVQCAYYDSDGDFVSNRYETDENGNSHYIQQDVPYKDLLVRKTDGKIWCVDNISEMLYKKEYYESYYCSLRGSFNENSHGDLYYASLTSIYGDGNTYKFNLRESSSSFEQITANIEMYKDFYILDNGVVWSHKYSEINNFNAFGNLNIGWPHSGFQKIDQASISKDIANELKCTIPGGSFTYYTDYNVTVDQIDITQARECQVFFIPYQGKPIAIITPEPHFKDFNSSGLEDESRQKLFECLEEGRWPFALAYDIAIGNTPGDSKLCDNPIKLIGGPLSAFNYQDFAMRISSCFVGDGYILTSGPSNWVTKIDIKNHEWSWLKKLNFPINFNNGLFLTGRIWSINPSRENFGAYWFDPVNLEDGFVKFNVEIPSFINLIDSAEYYNKCVRNGRLTISNADPATGDITTIVIDITTGKAVTDTQAPDMIFQTLINLN